MSREKEHALRIGVIQGGAIIEERLIRGRQLVSVGTAPDCTFRVSGEELPDRLPLFDTRAGQRRLLLGEGLAGKLSQDGESLNLKALSRLHLGGGSAKRRWLGLESDARGRIQLAGGLTLLFHIVPAPPTTTKQKLPRAATRGWLKSVEPVFTAVLAYSFFAHALTSALIFHVEPPPPPSAEDVQRFIARVQPAPVFLPLPKAPTRVASSDTPASPKPPKSVVKKPPHPTPRAKLPATGHVPSPKDLERIREQIRNKSMLALIGGRQGGPESDAFAAVMTAGSVLAPDLEEALRGSQGVELDRNGARQEGILRRRLAAPDGPALSPLDLKQLTKNHTPGRVATGSQRGPTAIEKIIREPWVDTTVPVNMRKIVRALRRQQGAVQACYERAIKGGRTIEGKLVIEFTLNEEGRVIEALIIEDSLGASEVNDCILRVIRRTRFSEQKDEVTITNPFVFLPVS